jgi:hypothetical protein
MTNTIPASDALKYAAALLKERICWTTDMIAGSGCDHDGHERETDALNDIGDDILALATRFGDPRRYSTGRLVWTSTEIVGGVVHSHVWHPDPAAEGPRSWRGHLPSDPGVPSPGLYEVSTDPATQEIHVRVVRSA